MTADREIRFSTLHPDGSETDVRTIQQATIMACPHVIIVANHYREDGSCLCDDPDNADMAEWGYTWDADERRWV